MFRLIDESPRWLLSVGKNEEAQQIITKVVEINGDSKFRDEMSTTRLSQVECCDRESWAKQLKTLLKHKVLFYRLIVMASSWSDSLYWVMFIFSVRVIIVYLITI